MKHPRPNYLRTYRKRARVAQRHVAFLVGAKDGSKISRYEQYARVPDLLTVFALEVIFGVPARELFAGMFEDARRLVEDNAAHAIRGPDRRLVTLASRILGPSVRPPAKSKTTLA